MSSNQILRNSLGNKCQNCGSTGKLCLYHKDSNQKNNAISNLKLLCPKCRYKEWAKAHVEHRSKYHRAYYLKRKKEDLDYVKKQYARLKADPDRYAKALERSRIRHRRYYAERRPYYYKRDEKKRHFLINYLGGKCVKCGYSDNVHALELDHKNGDGPEDRKKVGKKIARYYVKHLEEAKEKLQVLCSNCNSIKAHTQNEYDMETWVRHD